MKVQGSIDVNITSLDTTTLKDMMGAIMYELSFRSDIDGIVRDAVLAVVPKGQIHDWIAGLQNRGDRLGLPPGPPAAARPATKLEDSERALVEAGYVIRAIKQFRERTMCDLRGAKEEVDAWKAYARARRIEMVAEAYTARIDP